MIKKIILLLCPLLTIFFSISITSCSNSSSSSSDEDKLFRFEWDEFPVDGEYIFTFNGTEDHSDDIVKVYMTKKTGEETSVSVEKNGKTVNGAVGGHGFSTTSLGIEINHTQIGRFYMSYDRECEFHLTVFTREKDYSLTSFTIDGENAPVKNNIKTYELQGKPVVFWINNIGEEYSFTSDYTFHPGETIIIRYEPRENYNFTEKYYLALCVGEKVYKRAAKNVNELSYIFTKDDVDLCFQAHLIGQDEYEYSDIYKWSQYLWVRAND